MQLERVNRLTAVKRFTHTAAIHFTYGRNFELHRPMEESYKRVCSEIV